jgi:hypothetical protein
MTVVGIDLLGCAPTARGEVFRHGPTAAEHASYATERGNR